MATRPAGAAPANSSQAGALFGLPGITRPTEQAENNDGLAITPAAATQTTVTGMVPFKQTDVIKAWRAEFTVNATYAAGTTTLNLSQYFPYNFVGPLSLQYQGQWSPINVQSGIDAAIFQSYRPYQYGEQLNGRNLLDTSPASLPYNAQANLVSASNYTAASTKFQFTLDLPGGLDFDRYFPIGPDGSLLSTAPMKAFVSPQYMAGSARIVTPSITMNQLVSSGAGTTDVVPIYGSGTQTTPASVSGVSGSIGFQRVGWYQPTGASDSPVIMNWQYTRQSRQYSIAGRSTVDLPIPLNGQILSVFVRLYDPAANTISTVAYGAPISVANVSKAQVLYGSGLYRFQDTPLRAQERFMRQHQFLPPQGVIIWDMAQQNDGLITNAEVLNTMTTAGCTVHLEFTGAQSSSAYAVIGVEALTYVEVVS
jgi:hypothetical protein